MKFMQSRRYWAVFLVVLAVIVTGAAATDAENNVTDDAAVNDSEVAGTIVETAESAGQFTTLLAALDAAGLTDELDTGGPYTVFAPNDDAFAAIPNETFDALLADPEGDLTTILNYHVVEGEYLSEDLASLESIDTVAGIPLTITVEGDTVMVNGAQVIAADTMASNGVIHEIDVVMVPEGVELEAAEEATEEPAENMTEEAAEEATEEPAENMTEEAAEEATEEPAENMTEEAAEEATEEPVEEMTEEPVVVSPAEGEALTVVDCIAAEANMTSLVGMLELTGLNETLSNETQNFTIFAPNDEAFAMLPGPMVNFTVNNTAAWGLLEQVLLYHVVNGTYTAADLEGVTNLTTMQNETLAINVTDGNVTVNEANVTVADIQCSNGIVHIIDSVLMPSFVPNMTITETAAAEGNLTTLVTALNLTGLNATLSEPGPFTVFAPTDEAFAALPEGTLDFNDTEMLNATLTYHVVPGWYLAANFENITTLQTVQGANLTFTYTDGNVTVNGANVTVADVHTTNGEIHVIDAVLLPPENETAGNASEMAS